jgi:hypothetical protein
MTSVKNHRDDSSRGERAADAAYFQLADSGWERLFDDAMARAGKRLRIVCPFIKRGTVERLLNRHTPETIEVLTRFDLRHFCDRVSDVEAMALLLEKGARIRGIRDLHAKVYLFGSARAIVTSANLTRAALRSNHEFGFVSNDPSVLTRCEHYFDTLWAKAAPDLTSDRVAEWGATVARHRLRFPEPVRDGLTDEGVDVGLSEEDVATRSPGKTSVRSFVKFFGASDERIDRSSSVRDTVDDTGCHWACTYPKGRRPRQVEDGSVMFMARLVSHEDDIIIFGRALAQSHNPTRDDASASEIRRRGWKKSWPHYVRVYEPEFIDGDLHDGVSLYDLMDALEENSFVSTQRNAKAGHGNTNPRAAYRRHPHVELSPQGYRWVSDRLEAAFAKHGRLPKAVLASID